MDRVGSTRVLGRVAVDGELVPPEEAVVSALDIGLQRGYGCFEALRSYRGVPFRVDAHCARLAVSAEKLAIPLPPVAEISRWITERAGAGGDCVVRVLVTGGRDPASPGTGTIVVVFAEPLPPPSGEMSVLPVDAPWHPDGAVSELTGAKTLSYGPNLAATLAARRAGYDDALLVGRSGFVLEGPTYGVAWARSGTVETPSLDLGILASITREVLLEVADRLGVAVVEGRFDLDRLLAADEVFALSSVKEILPITGVGGRALASGQMTGRLQSAFAELVAGETGAM